MLGWECFCRKLVFLQILFRHGARYPTFINSDDYTSDSRIANHSGELTIQGKNMHYLLGKAFYKKYWKKLFEGTNMQNSYDHKSIYVQSTNLNRTIESAESQLRGWLQNLQPLQLNKSSKKYSLPAFKDLQDYVDLSHMDNKNWNVFQQLPKYQSIPIHVGLGNQNTPSSNPFDQGDFLRKYDSLNCPAQNKWSQQNFDSQMGKYIQNLPQVKQAILVLQQSFPSIKMNYTQAYKYIDNAECMEYLGQKVLPIFQNQKYSKIFKYLKEVTMFLMAFGQPIQYQAISTKLFRQTISNIKKGIEDKGPKLVLYSAHDTTVGLMLATLNLSNVQCINKKYLNNVDNDKTCVADYPPFTANLAIEIYKEDIGQNNYTMQLVFNNIQRSIPFCDNQMECKVERFYDWYDGWKISFPNKVCGIEDNFEVQLLKSQSTIIKLYIIIAILSIILIISGIWYWTIGKNSMMEQLSRGSLNLQKVDDLEQFEKKEMSSEN